MANIATLLNTIKNAVYGKDMRLALHDAIKATNDDVETKEPKLTAGTSSQYYRGDKTWQDLPTPIRNTSLSGLSTSNNSAITSSDTVLAAFGKLQAQMNTTERSANKGVVNGYAGLDNTGKVPVGQLPDIAITDTFVVSSQSAMLALTAQIGDVAVRTDLNKSFILKASPSTTLANWQELLTPTDTVLSVNGETGVVALTAEQIPIDDIGEIYTAENVEEALQEVGDKNYVLTVQVGLHKDDEDNPHSVTATQLGLDVTKSNIAYAHATNAIGGANLFDQERWNILADEQMQEYIIPLANSDFEVGGTYTVSGDFSSFNVATIIMEDEIGIPIGSTIYISSAQSFTIPEGTVSIYVDLYSSAGAFTPDELIPIMINQGSTALPYEPYIAPTANPHNVTAEQIPGVIGATVDSDIIMLDMAKVNTFSIVNDLTTGGATAPLSAEQGKVLNSKVNELTTYGVVSGLEVSAQSTPDMTVKCSAGVVYMPNYTRYSISTVASLAIDAADATYGRIDLVYINSSGIVSYLAGTAAETPSVPSVPAGGLALAQISVAALSTTVEAAAITDRKKPIWQSEWYTPTFTNGWSGTAQYCLDQFGWVRFRGYITGGTLTSSAFQFGVGLRVNKQRYIVCSAGSPGATNSTIAKILISTNGAHYPYLNDTEIDMSTVAYKIGG